MKKLIILVVAILVIGAGAIAYISSKDSNTTPSNNKINTQSTISNTISADTTNSNNAQLSKSQDNMDNTDTNVSKVTNNVNSNSHKTTDTNSHKTTDTNSHKTTDTNSHKIISNSNKTSPDNNNLNSNNSNKSKEKDNLDSSKYSISEFYGTWKATKVRGACPINTGTTASEENRLLIINKSGASFGDFVTHTPLYIKKINSNQFWNENRCYPESAKLSADSLYEITNSDEIIPIYILDSNNLVVSADGMFFLYTRV